MNIQQIKTALANNVDQQIAIKMSDGSSIAPHFHITEVGKVTKDFVDCGGTVRQTVSCMFQTLVADDTDHRLVTTKLAEILEKAAGLGLDDSVEVEAEVQTDSITIYSIDSAVSQEGQLVFQLASKSTACLAPDKCGIPEVPLSIQLTTDPVTAAADDDGGCCGGGGGG